MHELSITRNVVTMCAERAGDEKVTAVKLIVGKLSGIEVEAIRFCFDIVAQGTPLEGAALTIEEPEGLGTCRQCGKEVPLERPIALCPCPERARLDITAGEELLIKEMETCVAPAAAATRTR